MTFVSATPLDVFADSGMDRDLAPRCCLSVSGGDAAEMAEALESGADEIVLDLENSGPASCKTEARKRVFQWLRAAEPLGIGIAVLVNPPRSAWCHADIEACASAEAVRSIVVPKVENAGDLAFVDRLLDGVEAAHARKDQLRVQALIETAGALAKLDDIVTATPRLRSLILGYADLAASLGSRTRAGTAWLPVQHQLLVAARAAGIGAIDGPFLSVADDEDFAASAEHAARLGFDGKWTVHPRQIETIITAFTPDQREVAAAGRVLAALAQSRGLGAGSVTVDGQMIDEAVAAAARRTLGRAARSAPRWH